MSTIVWLRGKLLDNGIYKIERHIGEGGYGVTYLAKSGRNFVVVKTLKTSLQSDSRLRVKFEDEAKRLRAISSAHLNIVNFIDSFYEADVFCIVMEYIEGINLRTLLQNEGRISEQNALDYIRQIGEALSVVHKAGLIHRDIKPSNIVLCSKTGRCVLIDFGIARELSWQQVNTNIVPVSRGFSPVEQYSSVQARGAYSDVYALSATLYVLLTGEDLPPSIDRQAGGNNSDPLIPPRELNPRISPYVNWAILRGLAISPQQRPQKVEEWLALLSKSHQASYFYTIYAVPKQVINECRSITYCFAGKLTRFLTGRDNLFVNLTVASFILLSLSIYINAPYFLRFIPSKRENPEDSNQRVPIDYTALEEHLKNKEFVSADEETFGILRSLSTENKKVRYLDTENLDLIPCEVITELDNLWLYYSDSSFGFSIQEEIWTDLNGRIGEYNGTIDSAVADEFINKVGWENEYKLGFHEPQIDEQLRTAKGYFPLRGSQKNNIPIM